MNSSKVSNQMNTMQIGSKANQINSKSENFSNTLSLSTYSSRFKKSTLENLFYRKTISYLRGPPIKDLLTQTNLNENKNIIIDKNYLVNLIKIKSKKHKNNLPTIKTLNTFSPKSNLKLRIFSIDFNNKNRDKFHMTYNYYNKNANKEKINDLYQKIYNNQDNMKCVTLNKLIKSCKKEHEKNIEKENSKFIIKPRMIKDDDRNFIISQKKFMRYHGAYKKKKFNHNFLSYDFKRDKYPNEDSTTIKQLFLKKKLKIMNNDMNIVKEKCKEEKNNLIHLFDTFNQKIQNDIDEVYYDKES